jgi:hypothetical protein
MMLYIRRVGDATYKSTHKNNYNVKEEVMNNPNEKTQMTLMLSKFVRKQLQKPFEM